MLHGLAFAGLEIQKALSDLEDRIFADRFAEVAIERPVFVTALPRAGTTLLLEVLSAQPDFAVHSYRNMPFLLCPLIWDSVSKPYRKTSEGRERAHGDGMTVDPDSPEAFEEVVWTAFWGSHYGPERIEPWSSARGNPEFESFLKSHMRKIVALGSAFRSRSASSRQRRYLSKNNANIARLGLLTEIFPDARILLPFRNPIDHATSLHRQHARFVEIHGEDRFARQYMQWLGHFEFGAALRPIDFGGWLEQHRGLLPIDPNFWLAYWCEAYEAVLENLRPAVCLLDYDQLCAEPGPALAGLAEVLELADTAPLVAQAERFHAPTRYLRPPRGLDPALERRASAIHQKLREVCY